MSAGSRVRNTELAMVPHWQTPSSSSWALTGEKLQAPHTYTAHVEKPASVGSYWTCHCLHAFDKILLLSPRTLLPQQHLGRAANLITCNWVRQTKKMSEMEVSKSETCLWKKILWLFFCWKYNHYDGDCHFSKSCRLQHVCSSCKGPSSHHQVCAGWENRKARIRSMRQTSPLPSSTSFLNLIRIWLILGQAHGQHITNVFC